MSHVWTLQTPTEREFDCKRCGTHVSVTERSDRRMVFCCAYCEREFWRHRDRYERRKDISQGHATHLSREHCENRREAGL